MIVEIAVDILEAMMPVEDDMAAGDLFDPSPYQLRRRRKVLSTYGKTPGIDICLLEMCEEQLAWRNIIAMGTQDHIWQLQSFGDLEKFL